MHLKVFTKCQMLCNAYDDMSGFSILNTRGVTPVVLALANICELKPLWQTVHLNVTYAFIFLDIFMVILDANVFF